MLAATKHKFWDNFCRAVDRDDLRDVKDSSVLVDFQVEEDGRTDLLDDPHTRARDVIDDSVHPAAGPFTTIGWPAVIRDQHYETHRYAPALGEHTVEILAELGHGAKDVAKVQEQGVV